MRALLLSLLALPLVVLHRIWRLAWPLSRRVLSLGIRLGLAVAVAVHAFPYPTQKLDPDRGGPLIITDRHGNVLYRQPASDGRPGREAWVPLDRIASHAVLTLIASEDRRFFEHAGVDPQGVLRAAALNLRARRVVYGGSTITMQLVRMLHSAGQRRTWTNKVKEAILALRMELAVDKRTILEQYLNRAYYGNGAYGIEAAAQLYFGKPAHSLSVGEATLLAVLPRAPHHYNPLKHLDRALQRRQHVLGLLQRQGLLSGREVIRAEAQPLLIRRHRPRMRAPHFVRWVLDRLPEGIKRQGGVVRTSQDLALQERLEHRVREHVARLRPMRVRQAGLVVLDTRTGEVRAMVGSPHFGRPRGQVNIAVRRRHPGSALKPFVYALALEQGGNPASIAYDMNDVPSAYRLLEVTQREHGPVRYREALAGSYNLAAVHVLEKVGVEALMSRLMRAGLGPLEGAPREYGLQLALGSAKVRLVRLAAAYGFLVRGGAVTDPRAVLSVRRSNGSQWQPRRAPQRQLFSPEVSWLTMDMLADPTARRPMFGQELPVDLPYRVAVKTGTSRGFADTVAIGVTREITVAAWAGNFDGRPMHGVQAMHAAAPLLRDGLLMAGHGRALRLPQPPQTLTRRPVCPLSGLVPGPHCPHRKLEYFVRGAEPTVTCHWHQHRDGAVQVVYPSEARAWARRQQSHRI